MEDEEKIYKNIYFIFSQKSEGSEIFKLEENENVKNVKIIKHIRNSQYSYLLYSFKISNIANITLFLTNYEEKYIGSIKCLKIYTDNFIYQIDFKPFNQNLNNNLNQIVLPYKEQFIIFKKNIVNENNDLFKYLVLSSLDFILTSSLNNAKEDLVSKLTFEFDYFLYLFISSFFLNDKYPNEKLLNIFLEDFNLDLIDIEKSFNKNDSNKFLIEEIIDKKELEPLNEFNKIYSDIKIKTGTEKDDLINVKIDILLTYYYFIYKKKIFINFISDNNTRKAELVSNLNKNRKLFKDFTSEILDFDIFNEAENLLEIQNIISLIPNLPELTKLLSMEELYLKCEYLGQIEGKIYNLYKIIKPKKDDNIELLKTSTEDLVTLAKEFQFCIFNLSNELFIEYCEMFFQQNLKNIEIIVDIYKNYHDTIIIPNEDITEELISYYYETGLYLINSGKLANNDLIKFVVKMNKLKQDVVLPEGVYNSINTSNDINFINNLLNDDLNLGQTSIRFIEGFFNNFKVLKDFTKIEKWNLNCCENDEIIFLCFNKLKSLWLKENEARLSKDFCKFISQLIIIISKKKSNFINELIEFEIQLKNRKIFLDIFALTLNNEKDHIPEILKNHIIDYIDANIKENEPLSIYYKLITLNYSERIPFLLNNLTIDYAIKVEDFINYPNTINERIVLFSNLYDHKYFHLDNMAVQKTEYYKESTASKDKLNTLKYKDAIHVWKNITYFQSIFLYFLPKRINDENDYLIDTLLINFYENFNQCKEQYNNLKLVLDYWKHFFIYVKKEEINTLNNFLNELENTSISEFNHLQIKIESFLFYVNEAITKDKLYNSFFFMGLYKDSASLFQEIEQVEKFQYTLMRFNDLKSLGINSDIDNLPFDLLNKLIELVYKNNDRLDDELNFIKDYFEFENNKNNFFDKNKIKRAFTNKVNDYKKINNLDDYEIEFDDDDFSLIKLNRNSVGLKQTNINSNKITSNKDNDDEGFNLFTDDGDDDFTLLGNNNEESSKINSEIVKKEKEIDNNVITDTEKIELLKEINLMANDFYNIYRINSSYGDDIYEENILLFQKFTQFFWDTFKNIHKYEILPEKGFYEDILLFMKKIFLASVGINYFKKENNDKIIYLIYEFYEILEIYKKYHLIKKLEISNIMEKIIECKEKDNEDIANTESLEHLLSEIEENLKGKNLFNLPINILLMHEKIKNDNEQYNTKIIDIILRDDNKHLLNDAIPLIDKLFNKEITSRINLDEEVHNNIAQFSNFSLNQIDKKCNASKELEELLLFYFESKLTKIIFSKSKKNINEKNIYLNESMKNYLKQCLNLLEKESRNELFNQENKNISILFSIAFIKCFLSNYINYLYIKNQDLGNVDDINNNIITGYGNNPFRTSVKLYILKLFYNILGSYKEFIQFGYGNYQINYFQNEDIKKINEQDIGNLNKNQKMYGFDYLFITLQPNEFDEYINIEKNLIDLFENNYNNNLVSIINNAINLDNFICAIINLFLSNYHNQNYFNSDEYKIISKWLIDNLNNNSFYKINNLTKNILLLFIDKNNYENKIIKIEENVTYGSLTYNQLLTLLFSFRYVLNTLLNNNQNNLYYQILSNGKKIIENNNNYFFYYNKDYNLYENREINCLTFTIIRFILLSHLYFSYLLKNIDLNDINKIFNNNDDNKRMLTLLEQEFDLIKKILSLKGIRNIIIFMNYILNDIKQIINNIDINNDENYIKNIELNIESEISKYLNDFNNYVDNYNNLVQKIKIKEENNEFKKIIFEDKNLYNDKNIDKKYKFIQYLTISNFSSITDFKNQFLYYVNEKHNYPMINCILNNTEIMTITSNLPYINSFINEVYNELVLKIKKEDLDKKINVLLSDNILNKIEIYNKKINEINKLKSFNNNQINEINQNSKISEIINIKNNSIYNLFDKIIKIYNEFLFNTKIYKDNKNLIESIIIQNASKEDYVYLNNYKDNDDIINYNDNNYIAPIEKLEDILSLYSKRNRYDNKILNVYNGSKINYDFNQIETMLQKEYLYGKKPFKQNQKTFIFSNEVFSEERNNLINDLKNKYKQEDITEQSLINEIEKFVNNENNNKENSVQIYTSIQYILIYLGLYDINNYDGENISLQYIAKIIKKNNYNISDLLYEFLNKNKETIHINNLLFLYEKIELKCFEHLTEELCNEMKGIYVDEKNEKIIMEYFKNDKLLLNEEILLNSFKKYILRYCIGNNQNKNEIKNNIQLEKILNKEDIWEEKIFKDEKFKEESKELEKINNEKNILIKYCLNKCLKIKKEQEKPKSKIEEPKEEQLRKRRTKKIKY